MSFTTSINIERDFGKTPHYIVTANARQTIGKIINHFASGIHSFCLIGSYGTGKSSFILALENCLCGKTVGKNVLLSQCGQFNINPAKRKAMVAKNEKRFLKQKRNVLQKSESLSFRSDYPVKIQASFKRLLKAV